jgi:hypothetical protein
MDRHFVVAPSEVMWKKATDGKLNPVAKAILERLRQDSGKGVTVAELKKIDPNFSKERVKTINFMLRTRGAKCEIVPMCDVAEWDNQELGLSAV